MPPCPASGTFKGHYWAVTWKSGPCPFSIVGRTQLSAWQTLYHWATFPTRKSSFWLVYCRFTVESIVLLCFFSWWSHFVVQASLKLLNLRNTSTLLTPSPTSGTLLLCQAQYFHIHNLLWLFLCQRNKLYILQDRQEGNDTVTRRFDTVCWQVNFYENTFLCREESLLQWWCLLFLSCGILY